MSGKLFTIGHSTLEQKEFLKLLSDKGVNTLVDVRSTPYSRFASQFNAETISSALGQAGIQYIHEPEAFGARRTEKELYSKDGYVDFNKVRNTPLFKQKLNEYAGRAQKGDRIAFMCSEKDPLACHRTILVARAFSLAGIQPEHILSDGKLLSQKDVDDKLVGMYFPDHNEPSLFAGFENERNDDLVQKAYDLQNVKIGYKLADLTKSVTKTNREQGMKQWTGMDANGTLLSTKDRIASFRGEYGFLSNMHDCPVTYHGVTYSCSETAYQAQCCAREEDRKRFYPLAGVQAKRLAKQVEVRKDWHSVKAGVMEEILQAKFRQNPHLAERLMATEGKELVEGNKWFDTYWGVYNGRGQNVLGELLMKVRKELLLEKAQGTALKAQDNGNTDREFVISVTGHRPNRLFGYDWQTEGNKALLTRIETTLKETIEEAKKQGYRKFRVVTGMALGIDQMFMAQAQKLAFSKEYKGSLVTEAAVPFQGQESKWNKPSQDFYQVLLSYCDYQTVVSPGAYSAQKMQTRNEYMVDKSDIVLSAYDGKSQGGTKNCIDYARKKGVPVKDVGLPDLLQQYPLFERQKKSPLANVNRPFVEKGVEGQSR